MEIRWDSLRLKPRGSCSRSDSPYTTEKASSEESKTCGQTHSGAQDMYASEETAFSDQRCSTPPRPTPGSRRLPVRHMQSSTNVRICQPWGIRFSLIFPYFRRVAKHKPVVAHRHQGGDYAHEEWHRSRWLHTRIHSKMESLPSERL